ncbi:MAG: hypothetical protein CMJ18_21765 [Phycisphaeraceae bacterium]|nr:hypothetical protein [Phycisphaeraceae bacterium]
MLIAAIVLASIPFAFAGPEDFESHIRTWELPRTKIIEWDWETSFYTLEHLNRQIRNVERPPFDGMVITINHADRFYKDGLCHEVRWTEQEMQPVYDALASIEWKAYTHNFIAVFAGESHLGKDRRARMDWFNDEHWDNVLHNLRLLTRAAVAGKCVGLLFDPETYHRTVWNYYPNPRRRQKAAEHFGTKSYDEYFDQVRRRGAQYMEVIQSEMPECVIFNAYLAIRIGPSTTAQSIYGFYHAFLNGMLDAAGPGITFVDGNESSYSYKTKADFDRGYSDIRHRKLAYIAPENRRKYNAQVQAAPALFMDEIFGIGKMRRWTGTHMAYPDRVRLFEECLVHAMDASDEYVWIYAEKMNWRNERVPSGAIDAMKRARARVEALSVGKRRVDEQLGQAVREAMERRDVVNRWTDIRSPLIQPKSVSLYRDANADSDVTIDGRIDERTWEGAAELRDFTHLLYLTRDQVTAPTTARVTWSDRGLYLGITCSGLDAKRLADNPESERKRNSLRLVIAADVEGREFRRLDFNMNGFARLAANKLGERTWRKQPDPAEAPKTATAIGDDEWTAEWFIPWSCVGGKPAPNSTRKVTLARQCTSPSEYTSWSPKIDPNLWDSENLGTWRFRE